MGIGSPSLYAAFGSKEALYAEALRHYTHTYEDRVWAGFFAAPTAREAVAAYLRSSASGLISGCDQTPNGCMVTLSAVGSEGHADLGDLVRSARASSYERLKARLEQGRAAGEFPADAEIPSLARFIQTVQSGMSILARDGAGRAELVGVADVALMAWSRRANEG